MFILGFHFPASEGNKIEASKVVEKVDAEVASKMGSVKEIKLYEGSTKNDHVELYKTLDKTDSFLSKALVHYFLSENEEKEPKYMLYTNKYQMSALSKELDKDPEIQKICRKFDGMDTITVDVAFN
ncbi:MAG: hypothetical protein ACLFOC_00935 [Campylobacterales bacterium]